MSKGMSLRDRTLKGKRHSISDSIQAPICASVIFYTYSFNTVFRQSYFIHKSSNTGRVSSWTDWGKKFLYTFENTHTGKGKQLNINRQSRENITDKYNFWSQIPSRKGLGTASTSSVQHRILQRNVSPGGYGLQSYTSAQKSPYSSAPDLTNPTLQGKAYLTAHPARQQGRCTAVTRRDRAALPRITQMQELRPHWMPSTHPYPLLGLLFWFLEPPSTIASLTHPYQ